MNQRLHTSDVCNSGDFLMQFASGLLKKVFRLLYHEAGFISYFSDKPTMLLPVNFIRICDGIHMQRSYMI